MGPNNSRAGRQTTPSKSGWAFQKNDHANWDSEWKGKPGLKDKFRSQLRVTVALLAALSFDGTHPRRIRKDGNPWPARSESWAPWQTPVRAEWEESAKEILVALEAYRAELDKLDTQLRRGSLIQAKHELTALTDGKLASLSEQLFSSVFLPSLDKPQFIKEMSEARELWITGLSLRRIYDNFFMTLQQVVERGKTVNVVVLDANASHACRFAARQESGPDADAEAYTRYVAEVNRRLDELKANHDNLTVKRVNQMLTFGIDAFDPDDPEKGLLYVHIYPLWSRSVNDDQPKLKLRPQHGYPYKFFREQLPFHWDFNWD
ncbi:MAG: hypothetical protein WB760_22330 [Xanthobacteraceae bacterium]